MAMQSDSNGQFSCKILCEKCDISFPKFSLYRAHVKKLHPADFNDLPRYKLKENAVAKCDVCQKQFVKRYNLKVHMKRFHPDKCTIQRKIYNYKCEVCSKQFTHLRHFKYHQKQHNPETDSKKTAKCPLCYEDFTKQTIFNHFKENHTITIETETLQFSTPETFKTWKIQLEKSEHSSFVKAQGSYTAKGVTKTKYICHRSGNFTSKSKGVRRLKAQGTNKINAYCPASLQVTESNNGIEVLYVKTHIGHEADMEHLFLSETDRVELAGIVAAKVPFDTILNEMRDSVTNSELGRLHLLTKKDLFNIRQCFQLNDLSVTHKNEAVNLDDWVEEMKNSGSVLYYKPQESDCLKYPSLNKEDFVLIVMNEAQKDMLQRFGNDCVCLDRTCELNSYEFELHTLLVLDQNKQGFPCSFVITNRSDTTVMLTFFSEIREALETQIKPEVFMSDIDESFYNAWKQVMLPADVHLFCTWHVDHDWRKNLEKIDSKELQETVHQKLRGLLQETGMTAFNCTIPGLVTSLLLNPETSEFGSYFQQNYLHNVTSWAYCHRLYNGLNTNTHIERVHNSIKYLFLHGKGNKRLDKAVQAILKFVCDNLVIAQNNGKFCMKIKLLWQRHKASEKLDLHSVLETTSPDNTTTWQVPSTSSKEIYLVEKLKTDCDCKIICSDCNVCLHQYSCSCLDYSIHWNMCKHIHLVCRFRKILQTFSSTSVEHSELESINKTDINVEEHVFDSTTIKSVNEEQEQMDKDFDSKLKEFKTAVTLQLDNIKTWDQLEAIRDICAPIQPTLEAMERKRNHLLILKNKITNS